MTTEKKIATEKSNAVVEFCGSFSEYNLGILAADLCATNVSGYSTDRFMSLN